MASKKTDILSKLVCSKCNHYLSFFPIYLSQNQEKICGRCHKSEEAWFRLQMFRPALYTRSEIYEEIARDLTFPCRYKQEGCLETRAPADVPSHENTCLYRIVSCATKTFSKCTWQGPFVDLAQHCDKDHSPSAGAITFTEFKDSFDQHYIVKLRNGVLFLIKLDYNVNTNVLSATCTYLGSKAEALSNFSCKLVLANGNVSASISPVIGTLFSEQKLSQISLDHVKTWTNRVSGQIEVIESDAGKKANKELLIELKCPVCFCYMTGPIYQCSAGHSLCDRCHPSLSSCPLCHAGFELSRNYTLEKIANLLVFPCENSESAGCNFISEPALVREHEQFCLSGARRCPLECGWKGDWKKLPLHIEKLHSDCLLKTNSKCVHIDRTYFMEERVDLNFLMLSRNLLFLIKFFCDRKFFLWEVQYVGPTEEVENFHFEIQIRSDQSDALLGLMRAACCSFRWGRDKPGRQFACFPVHSIKPFICNSFTYRIDILN